MHAIYCRVSTDEQAKTGYSLESQVEACKNKLLSLGIVDAKEYIDDGYSGEFLERPHLDELRNDLREGYITTVIVYDPDRLSRNLTNQLLLADEIEKSGAKLLFVTGDYDASPEGRLFFSMKGAVSAYEKAKIRERSLHGKRTKAKKGKIVLNNNPYGFNWDAENSTYIINEEEAKVIRSIYDMCITNHWGTLQIASELMHNSVYNRRGKPFSTMAVYRILTKELYCGTAFSSQIQTTKAGQRTRKTVKRPREEWIPIPVPPIVSRETWEEAQRVVQQNRDLAKRNTKYNYLLRGFIKCGVCGMGMVAGHVNSNGTIRRYYRCVKKSSSHYMFTERCKNRFVPVEILEDTIWNTFVSIAKGNASLNDFMRVAKTPDYSKKIAKLEKQHAELTDKQTEIIKWFRSNIISNDVAQSELSSITKELAEISSNLSNLKAAQSEAKKPIDLSSTDILNATTFDEKRNVIVKLGLEIHVRRIEKNFEYWFE